MAFQFKSLDTNKALGYLGGNEKLYHKLLLDFHEQYGDFELTDLSDEAQSRALHTLKGLSANIGANELHTLCQKMYDSKDISLFSKIRHLLDVILQELDEKLCSKPTEKMPLNELTNAKTQELFKELENAFIQMEPKQSNEILEQLMSTFLSENPLFIQMQKQAQNYQFDEAKASLDLLLRQIAL